MQPGSKLDSPDTIVATITSKTEGQNGLFLTAETFGRTPRRLRITVPEDLKITDGPDSALRLWGRLDDRNGTMEITSWQDAMETAISILLCGGRKFQGWNAVERVLDLVSPELIIHGAAAGADSLAGRYARQNDVPCREFPAVWRPQGPAGPVDMGAGHARNQQMLDQGNPDIVLAFPGGPGTRNMVKRSREQGFSVHVYGHDGLRRHGTPQVVPDKG